MTQTISYVVDVKGATAAAGQVEHVENAFQRTEVAARRAGVAIDKATGPTRNVGHAALEASRAIEDLQYGLGGVVNNIPGLVMALGGTAGLTAVISLTAVGVNQLVKNAGYLVEEFGRTERESKALRSQVDVLAHSMSSSLAESFKKTQDSVKDARRELRLFGLEGSEIAMAEAEFEYRRALMRAESGKALVEGRKSQIAAMQAEAKAMEEHAASRIRGRDENGRAIGVFQQERYDEIQTNIALEKSLLDLNKSRVKQAEDVSGALAKEFVELSEINAEMQLRLKWKKEDEDATKSGAKNAEDMAKLRYDVFVAGLDAEDRALAEVQKARRDDAKKNAKDMADEFKAMDRERAKEEKALQRADDKAERERTALLKREAAERDRLREQEADNARRIREQEVQDLTRIGMVAASAVGTFAAQAAMGQEDALEGLIATASQVAGGQIMLKGGEVMATGIAGMLTAPNPLSAAQIAGGAALVAAGAAVQTGGPAAVSALMGKGGSSASPTASTRDPGASPRSSGGSTGSGGGLIVNVSYGAGGPLPEDVGREIYRATRSSDRRSGR
jgi:hypothetical protein